MIKKFKQWCKEWLCYIRYGHSFNSNHMSLKYDDFKQVVIVRNVCLKCGYIIQVEIDYKTISKATGIGNMREL